MLKLFIILIIIIVFSVCISINPCSIALVYVLVSKSEAFGVGDLFEKTFGFTTYWFQVGILLGTIPIVFELYKKRNSGLINKRKFQITVLGIIFIFWMSLSVFFHTGDLVEALLIIVRSGALGLIYAIGYYNNNFARKCILIALLFHLFVAFFILIIPGTFFDSLKAINPDELNEIKMLVGEQHVQRLSGQFFNAIQLSFYAGSGVLIGIHILKISSKVSIQVVGLLLLLMGIAISISAIQRGIWLGLLLGSYFVAMPNTKKIKYSLLIYTLIIFIVFILSEKYWSGYDLVYRHFTDLSNDTGVKYRILAMQNVHKIFLQFPIFGAGNPKNIVDMIGAVPHQCFLFYGATYGIPAGICMLLLISICIMQYLHLGNNKSNGIEKGFDSLIRGLGCILITMSLTNNMSAGFFGYIILGCCCLPYIHGGELKVYVRKSRNVIS